MKNTDKHNTGPPYNTYRLRFTDAERADPALTKTIRKADKDADKLEVVQAKIHKKKILKARRTVDAETGKSTVRLCFEEIGRKKPPSKLTHAVHDAPVNAALSQFHREIRQSEDDNVGVEAAHKSEETAELSVRAGRSAYCSHKLKPYRKSAKAESRLDRAISAICKKRPRGTIPGPPAIRFPTGGRNRLSKSSMPPPSAPVRRRVTRAKPLKTPQKWQNRRCGGANGRRLLSDGTAKAFSSSESFLWRLLFF